MTKEEFAMETASPVVDPAVVIHRPVYNQRDFEEKCGPEIHRDRTPRTKAKNWASKNVECSSGCLKNVLLGLFPFIRIMKAYSLKDDLPSDIIAGLTVGIMQIPQGMYKSAYND